MSDEYRFVMGVPMRMREDGSFRRETWRDRWAAAIAETVWLRPSHESLVVTGIDQERGVITLGRKP